MIEIRNTIALNRTTYQPLRNFAPRKLPVLKARAQQSRLLTKSLVFSTKKLELLWRTTKSQPAEEDLKAAACTPSAVHPNCPIWFDPAGVLMPGPGYAWTVSQNRLKQQ